MTSLPLDVHEVLEQEYEAIHGPLPNKPAATYRPEDILDPAWATSYLTTCGFSGDPRTVANDIVTTGAGIENLAKSPELSDTGRELLDLYSGDDAKTPEVRRRIVDEALGASVRQLRDVRLDALYSTLHAQLPGEARTALCISGGGIRSATFALGVIQGLASSGILNKFHYLSTVSGGGYIGSWLSSWSRRHKDGITGVQDDLVRADTGRLTASGSGPARPRPESKIDPEPEPLRHLREYSNYLSPKLGLLSADTWTMAALYIRNLLLNVLVLVPVLAAIIALPRLYEAILHGEVGRQVNTLGWITTLALAVGFGYLGLARPVKQGHESRLHWINTNKWFVFLCILPLTVAGFGFSIFWAKASDSPELLDDAKWWGVACALVMVLVPCVIYYLRFSLASFAERRQSAKRTGIFSTLRKAGVEGLGAIVGLVTAAGLFYVIAAKAFPNPLMAVPDPADVPLADRINLPLPMGEIFACFAVPLVLIVFFVQASIFVGISSRRNEDNDREWWGRAGAWLLMVAVMGGALSFISVFGPVLLYRAPVILGSMGGVAGIVAGLIGHSSKTPADDKQKKGSTSTATSALLGLAVPIFALALIAAISLGTTVVVQLMDGKTDLTDVAKQAQFTSTLSATPQDPEYTRKDEMKISTASVEVERGVLHLKRVHDTKATDLLLIYALALLAWILSRFIGVNRFSMQGLYRNRLIRAYLGASRYSRDPDSFTGFDENDNLQMYELRPELLWTTSFTDPFAFVGQIVGNCEKKGIEQTIWNGLNGKVQKRINQSIADPRKYPLHSSLINGVVQNVNLQMQTIDLVTGKPDGTPVELLRKNRATLEATFKMLKPLPERNSPFHVVNTTLNLVSGQKLAWQQRKAESLTVSPLHCGSFYLGYRDAREYGGDDGISLGTAVAVSGAAASPNQGYHSSLPLAFIMTLLNVRLGSWLGNPGLPGDGTFTKSSPRGNLETLFWELTGNTNDQCPWVYLSDGGHFENLGLYEMVLRRCRFIVLTDGGCDPKFNFDDLGNAIRKIRTDLGVPIEIKSRDMYPRPQPGQPLISGSYVATATIRYSAIDKDATDGVLIYLKPSVYDEDYLPRDVYNYSQSSETFPHESTSDQFFSESQFESYRALGRHVIDVICDGKPQSFANVGAFADHVAAIRRPKPPA
jgi:Patatin-like phospholipase